MHGVFILPPELRARIEEEVQAALPRECCGLIEGIRSGNEWRAMQVHATRNLAKDEDRFEIDPAEQFALMRALRETPRDIIGCYHSHPNGRAEPSSSDGDGEDGFVWLIAALDGADGVTLSAHLRDRGGWQELAIKSG